MIKETIVAQFAFPGTNLKIELVGVLPVDERNFDWWEVRYNLCNDEKVLQCRTFNDKISAMSEFQNFINNLLKTHIENQRFSRVIKSQIKGV